MKPTTILPPNFIRLKISFILILFLSIGYRNHALDKGNSTIHEGLINHTNSKNHKLLDTIPWRSITINEIMFDPTPEVGLSATEYVELYNAGNEASDLAGFYLEGFGSKALESFVLEPGKVILLTTTSKKESYSNALDIGSGSLNNNGEILRLISPLGHVVDSVFYQKLASDKNAGGWSLEQINPFYACSDFKNWRYSTNPSGGTPMDLNSVLDDKFIPAVPDLVSIINIGSGTLKIAFAKDVYLTSATEIFIDQRTLSLTPGYGSSFSLNLPFDLQHEVEYEINISGFETCDGRTLGRIDTTLSFDAQQPSVSQQIISSSGSIMVLFSEPVEIAESLQVLINDSERLAQHSFVHDSLLELSFSNFTDEPSPIKLQLTGISDKSQNTFSDVIFINSYQENAVQFGDIIISEIMADPVPSRGLPEIEYLELVNHSEKMIYLGDLSLKVGEKESSLPPIFLASKEVVALVQEVFRIGTDDVPNAISLMPWPGLKNSGDTLSVWQGERLISKTWYQPDFHSNAEQREGGYSYELKNLSNWCLTKENWMSAENELGGSPGKITILEDAVTDNEPPEVLTAIGKTGGKIELWFNEQLNPFANLRIDPKERMVSISQSAEELRKVDIHFDDKNIQEFSISGIRDCVGNGKKTYDAEVVRPVSAQKGDLVVNEIMFAPEEHFDEYVELYNLSHHYISLSGLELSVYGNSSKTVPLNSIKPMDPNSLVVLTKDVNALQNAFPHSSRAEFIELDLPQLINDNGSIVIKNSSGQQIDSAIYHDEWHHEFLIDTKGVSLEKKHPNDLGVEKTSWNSAAENVGFGTPGLPNSNFLHHSGDIKIDIDPKVIGEQQHNRLANISMSNLEPGTILNIFIFDLEGKVAANPVNNTLTSTEFTLIWDGTSDTGKALQTGYYIVLAELYFAENNYQQIKTKIAINRRHY